MALEKKTFLDLFTDPSPALIVKFSNAAQEPSKKIPVRNDLGGTIDSKGKKYLEKLRKNSRLSEFLEFYTAHDGFGLCTPYDSENAAPTTAIKLITSLELEKFNKQYLKGGKRAGTIDFNKSKELYRGGDSWIAFAEVDGGPACLTTFLDGENAGFVYYLTPEPHFNILKPIAKGFNLFLDRIAKDPAAFLRLVRSYVSWRGSDGYSYGYIPVEYSPGLEIDRREAEKIILTRPEEKRHFQLFKWLRSRKDS